MEYEFPCTASAVGSVGKFSAMDEALAHIPYSHPCTGRSNLRQGHFGTQNFFGRMSRCILIDPDHIGERYWTDQHQRRSQRAQWSSQSDKGVPKSGDGGRGKGGKKDKKGKGNLALTNFRKISGIMKVGLQELLRQRSRYSRDLSNFSGTRL